ncbi:phospholipase A2 AP-PLA2-I-like [Patiria miniata]|uniref:Phospholipase A2 n=1 Tax=Patiria miniata TaxID=46514 RepID=A0A914B5D1_PATMI|nr:phospholipase A2 AP-PLA2-I-like [Patiria miniata]
MKLLLIMLGLVAISSARGIGQRSLTQFASMYSCTVGLGYMDAVGDYFGYGCYCGAGGHGTPVDDTDECCAVHDKCYEDATSNGCSALQIYYITYDYEKTTASDGSCQLSCKAQADYDSSDNDAQCRAYMCNCDRKGSECFAKNRPTYDKKYKGWLSLFC